MDLLVLNLREFPPGRLPPRTKLIDRRTKWGNPFHIGPDGDRAAVIAKHRLWLPAQPHLMAQLHELRGFHLACWCAPEACHGHTLRELANA